MARVFTITEGLENMGALRTGGQGSVYKARRKDGTITAVKLLPTPVFSESPEDKNYRDFRNEVEKLRKVNEDPNPNVVTILNAGITETGNFPFIEMEFIEGPDLEELLKPPHTPVFTIAETIKVARHIANAIAHCHRIGVKHGDVKTNNVKLNSRTDNYVLLDFGLAVMSDEQRRTSLRHAGAIEFMAPEQNEGQMLFQSDVYAFGVVLYELLAGRVPFPLQNKGETARTNVMVAHMETPPPDLLALRRDHLPADWSVSRQQRELQLPAWLPELIYKCLEKDPDKRFANGMELSGFIQTNYQEQPIVGEERISLPKSVEPVPIRTSSVTERETIVAEKDLVVDRPRKVGRTSPLLLLLPILLVLGIGTYFVLGKKSSGHSDNSITAANQSIDTSTHAGSEPPVIPVTNKSKPNQVRKDSAMAMAVDTFAAQTEPAESKTEADQPDSISNTQDNKPAKSEEKKPASSGKYKVRSQAYFYNEPNEDSRRNAFVTHWDPAITAVDETDDFIYVIFTNEDGQTSKGWLRKKDLVRM